MADKKKKEKKVETFYDAKFSIEAMQDEPCENGFTWRAVVGALFIAFVMLPGVIFMGLMIGQDLGTAADWVVIILFVELARRSFMTLKKQELYMLRYTVANLSHIAGGMALGGGIFAWFVYNRYLRNSEDFHNFGIAHQVPDWFAPFGDAAFNEGFLSRVWWPALTVTILTMVLNKLNMLSLGFLAYKVTVDVEKLPFPLAPIHAEGAIALAESSQEKGKKGYRQHCFSIGAMIGAVFGVFYVGIPILSQAFLGEPIQLIPIPFWDLTQYCEDFIPGGTIGICLNLGLLMTGFVLPWRIVVGMFATNITFQLIVNPILQRLNYLPHWEPGKDAIQTHVACTLDLYLSVGIGAALAVFALGVWGMVKALIKHRKDASASDIDPGAFWRQNKDRGDPPTWVALVMWLCVSAGYVALSNHLVNGGIPENERFPVAWLFAFAFFWTPINSYINARMAGIAGQYAGVPFLKEAGIFASGYRHVNIWFAPLPLSNYGSMASRLRVCELTRTRFTSILKAELLIFPLMLVASYIFWTYVISLGPVPSDSYPFVQKFWPMHAQMRALWASAMQEGTSLLKDAIKPGVIVGSFSGILAMFTGFHFAGISSQFIYGGLGAMNGYPHTTVMVFAGACIGRFVLAKKFGQEKFQNYAPILAVGFGAGLGLVGMFAIALNFLYTSVGISY